MLNYQRVVLGCYPNHQTPGSFPGCNPPGASPTGPWPSDNTLHRLIAFRIHHLSSHLMISQGTRLLRDRILGGPREANTGGGVSWPLNSSHDHRFLSKKVSSGIVRKHERAKSHGILRISHHLARTGNLYHIAIAEETTISTRKIFYNIGPSSIFHHFPIFANGITLKQIPGDQGDPSSDPKSQPKHLTRCRRWSPFMSVYVQLQWTKMDQAFWKCFDVVVFLCWRSMFLHPNICWCSCMFFLS